MSSEHPVTIEDALEREYLDKWDFYSAVTGHVWTDEDYRSFKGFYPANVSEENSEQVYQLVLKLKNNPNASWAIFKPCFDDIELAFDIGSLDDRKGYIDTLLMKIIIDDVPEGIYD